MLKYLIVLLDDTSVPFCHYNAKNDKKLISLENLKKAVRWAMLENLNVQFVWPDYELTEEYKEVVSSIDHINFAPLTLTDYADVIVAEPEDFCHCPEDATVVARISLSIALQKPETLFPLFEKAVRINIVITDPENFHDSDIDAYRRALATLSDKVMKEMESGRDIQINLLTDRMALDGMNNCNAGWESLTLAPDGHIYICPAFYYVAEAPVGSVENGLYIKNPQLFRLDHAPICRKCDAWHCRRCIWLNKRLTHEVNTPGHEQCVMTHLEREATRNLSQSLRDNLGLTTVKELRELDYIDPFDKIIKNEL